MCVHRTENTALLTPSWILSWFESVQHLPVGDSDIDLNFVSSLSSVNLLFIVGYIWMMSMLDYYLSTATGSWTTEQQVKLRLPVPVFFNCPPCSSLLPLSRTGGSRSPWSSGLVGTARSPARVPLHSCRSQCPAGQQPEPRGEYITPGAPCSGTPQRWFWNT